MSQGEQRLHYHTLAGNVSGKDDTGGLIGYLAGNAATIVNKCYSSSEVTSTNNYVGGLIGRTYVSTSITLAVSDSYAVGNATGIGYVGGLIGYTQHSSTSTNYKTTLTNVYASGKVTGSTNVGGLVGAKYNSTTITAVNSYWILGTSMQETSGLGTSSLSVAKGTTKSSYASWDYTAIWNIVESGDRTFPTLRELPVPDKAYIKNIEYMDGEGTSVSPLTITNESQLRGLSGYKTLYCKLGNDITLSSTLFEPIADYAGKLDGDGKTITGLTIDKATSGVGLFKNLTATADIKNLTITNSSVKGAGTTGILAGSTVSGAVITNVKTSGTVVSSAAYTGGLIGDNAATTITGASSNANITSTSNYVGGLLGKSSGTVTITSCNATGAVEGVGHVGGLIGSIEGTGTVSNISKSYATGNITNTGINTGGLIGIVNGSTTNNITDCYASGNVSGAAQTGGFIGYEYGSSNANTRQITVKNSYSKGYVTGTTNVGGFVGHANYTTYITNTNCYWDKDTSGITTGVATSGAGKTTLEMTTTPYTGVYTSWDFTTIWLTVSGGYPTLR